MTFHEETNRPRRRRGPRPQGDRFWIGAERRGRPATSSAERSEIRAWFIGNLVDGWFVGDPEIVVDDYEIVVVGTLGPFDVSAEDASSREISEAARINRFREDSRDRRMTIAREAEDRFRRKVSWGAKVNETSQLFTTASVPVMTRLHIAQRQTLDTLVEANVARSRSEALAWCVDLVARNETEWIDTLRDALDTVTTAREAGPASGTPA